MDLVERDQEDNLWQLWLAKDFEEKSFEEFKLRSLKQTKHSKLKVPTAEEEQEIFAFTDQFIKPTNKGGEITNE